MIIIVENWGYVKKIIEETGGYYGFLLFID